MVNSDKASCESCGYSMTVLKEDGMGTISSVPQPDQNVPLSTDQKQKAEGNGDTSKDVQPAAVIVPPRSPDPQPPTRKNKAGSRGTECRDRWRLGVEIAMLIIGVSGLVGLYYTFSETRRQADIADKALRAAQQAYISLGKSDGTLMQWRVLEVGRQGMIDVYFQNTGNTDAREFFVNYEIVIAGNELIPGVKPKGQKPMHIRPVIPPSPSNLITKIIPGKSRLRFTALTTEPLSEEQVIAIKSGKIQVHVEGTFEFVDLDGEYCCRNMFTAWRSNVEEFETLPIFVDRCPKDVPATCDNGSRLTYTQ